MDLNKPFLSVQKSENDASLAALVPFFEAFENAPLGILVLQIPDSRIVFSNAEVERIIGLAKQRMIGRTLQDVYEDPEADWSCLHSDNSLYSLEELPSFKAVFQGEISKNREMMIRRPGGNEIWVINDTTLIHNKKGKVIAVVTFLSDITDKKIKEKQLRKSKEYLEKKVKKRTSDLVEANKKLETVLNTSSESIWVCDGDGTVLSINKASERLLKVTAEDVVGRNVSNLVGQGLMDRSVTMEVIATRRQVSMMQYIAKAQKSILVTGTPVIADDGTISMVIINERDLTQLNELREELQRARNVSNTYKKELTELNLLELRKQEIIAESNQMQQVLTTALKLANLKSGNILILGESGTGKGLLAKFIHSNGRRKEKSFIQINCAALPESLLEAELFGYERGAFTGARDQGKAGLMELAQGGTLFLDEIGELPLSVQAKLLKCLDEREFIRLGGLKPIKVDCMIIGATNARLEERVRNRTFRKDLFYRIDAFTIKIPALRDRSEDIFELIRFFLKKFNRDYGCNRRISSRGLDLLQKYDFPGNIRELKNILKKAVVMSEKERLDEFIEQTIPVAGEHKKIYSAISPDTGEGLTTQVLAFERGVLINAMDGNKTTRSLASFLNVSQSCIVRKLKKHKLLLN
ncbi:MAG: sigma 54-interacting transcriptional regulator [Deltaproteobacteria bacterium]|nr:sigma 54-interacting transcriptional regulator [Deltaproteobacteria bacterium]